MMVLLCGELKLPWSWDDTKRRSLVERLRSAATRAWNAFAERHGLTVHVAGIYGMHVAAQSTPVELRRAFGIRAFDDELGDLLVPAFRERVLALARRHARETVHGICVALVDREDVFYARHHRFKATLW